MTATVISESLVTKGMKSIVIAGKIACDFAYKSGNENMKHSTWDCGKFGIYNIIMVQYVPNTYKLECISKGNMTEEHRNVVKDVLKGCIDDGETKIKTSLIRDKLNENGMKAIVITADRASCDFAIQSSAETMEYSTWDLGKSGIYNIITVQYTPNAYKLVCTRKGNMTEYH
eukprot:340978_1